MLYIELHVKDVFPSMFSKAINFLSLNFIKNLKRKIPLWDLDFCGRAHNNEWDILDAFRGVGKLKKFEAIYIKK